MWLNFSLEGDTCDKISLFKIVGFHLPKNEARIEDIWIPLLLWTAQRWKTSYDSLSNGCPNGPSVTSIPKNSRKFSSASWGGQCFDVFSFSLLKNRRSVDEISNPLLLWTGVSSPTDDETGMTGPRGTTRTRGSELGESSGMILADNGPDLLGDACGKDISVMGDKGYTTNS